MTGILISIHTCLIRYRLLTIEARTFLKCVWVTGRFLKDTLSRGARYAGLDIVAGHVEMVNHQLKQVDLTGKATQGSILEPPFNDESFDAIVAIGCLHRTGNLKLVIDCCWNLLRPGGTLIFTVYYSYFYRGFRIVRATTARYMVKEMVGYRGVVGNSADRERAAYDAGSKGDCAPHTDWISICSLRSLCGKFSDFFARLENIDQEKPFSKTPCTHLFTTRWPAIVGLDLYATATK